MVNLYCEIRGPFTDAQSTYRFGKEISLVVYTQLLPGNGKRGEGNTGDDKIDATECRAAKGMEVTFANVPRRTILAQGDTGGSIYLDQGFMRKVGELNGLRLVHRPGRRPLGRNLGDRIAGMALAFQHYAKQIRTILMI